MKKRISVIALMAALGALVTVSACESKSGGDEAKAPGGEATEEAQEASEPAKEDPSDTWTRVESDALPEAKKQKLERAKAAQGEFGKTLVKTLTTAIGEGGYGNAIDVCNTDAPAIAEKVSKSNDLAIGRTSFKLRNPKNTPPKWAEPYVEDRVAETVVLDGPDDTLGYMAPIKMGELCVNCHGAPDQLAPDVTKTLAAKYPQDEATGFKEGDLRGWFWVRVD